MQCADEGNRCEKGTVVVYALGAYALKSALGGTDASPTAFGVDVVARTAEGHRGVDQGRGVDVDLKVKDKEGYRRGRTATVKGSDTGLQLR